MGADRPSRTGRLLSAAARVLGPFAALGLVAGASFVFQPFGRRAWTSGVVLALLAASAWSLRRGGRAIGTRRALVAGLAAWLALIGWSALSPGGPMPPPKADPASIRVLTWNILVGGEGLAPWSRHGWPVRKGALRDALGGVSPDILCVQEALDEQVRFLESALPRHRRVGVCRDDGRSAGEHCAIFFDADRFERLDDGTFWLEEPSGLPPEGGLLGPKRICTWVRLRERPGGRTLRVYNAHLYLTEAAQIRAARIILDRISAGPREDAVLLAGDFNAVPSSPSRAVFSDAGLAPVARSVGAPADAPTY